MNEIIPLPDLKEGDIIQIGRLDELKGIRNAYYDHYLIVTQNNELKMMPINWVFGSTPNTNFRTMLRFASYRTAKHLHEDQLNFAHHGDYSVVGYVNTSLLK